MGISSRALVSLAQPQVGSRLSRAQPVGFLGVVVVDAEVVVVVVVVGESLIGEVEGDSFASGFGNRTSVASEGKKGIMLGWRERERERESCLLYTSPSPRDMYKSRMPSSA